MADSHFNPRNILAYAGKTILTRDGSEYRITEDGRITGTKNIDGAQLLLIAGIREKHMWKVMAHLDPLTQGEKEKLDNVILEYGEEVRPRLKLVVSLTPESCFEKCAYGIISAPIKRVT